MSPQIKEKLINQREEVIAEFEKLLKDFKRANIHLKKRPNDYNEPHYLIYEAEEFHPIAEMYAKIGPGDDGTIKIYMMGSPLEQRIEHFIEDNVKDEKVREKLIDCVKKNMPSPPEEEKIKDYFEREAEKFKKIKLQVYG